MKDLYPVFGEVGISDGSAEHLHQVALGIVILGEDEYPKVTPVGSLLRWLFAGLAGTGAHVLVNPVNQIPNPRIC